MRFLLDQNRSPHLAAMLREAGHDAIHTLDVGLEAAEDADLLEYADEHDRIVISGDTDFGALLALARKRSPSVVLFRARGFSDARSQADVILSDLDAVAAGLEQGAVAVGRPTWRTRAAPHAIFTVA